MGKKQQKNKKAKAPQSAPGLVTEVLVRHPVSRAAVSVALPRALAHEPRPAYLVRVLSVLAAFRQGMLVGAGLVVCPVCDEAPGRCICQILVDSRALAEGQGDAHGVAAAGTG